MASSRSENFLTRVIELDLDECILALKAKGLITFAKFAFGSDYTSQQADAALLTSQLLEKKTPSGRGTCTLAAALPRRMLAAASPGDLHNSNPVACATGAGGGRCPGKINGVACRCTNK